MPLTRSCVAIQSGRFGSPYAYGNGVGTFQLGSFLYIACSNPGFSQGGGWTTDPSGTPPPILAQAHILKSADQGTTWEEVDAAGAPSVSLAKTPSTGGLTSPIGACYRDANTLLVAYFVWDYVHNSAVELRFSTFDLVTETWGAEIVGGPTSLTAKNLSIAYRASDGSVILEYDGLENVAGTDYSRVFYVIYHASWGAEIPIDAAQTGSTVNFNIAGVVSGSGNRTHLFYRTDTGGDSILLQSTLTSGNVLTAPVTITNQVDTSESGVPPVRAPWSMAVARVTGGATHIYIAYVKVTDTLLYFQGAVSANVPVFTEQLIGTAGPDITAGIFNAGLTLSRGLVASSIENGSDMVATGSLDETTWEATTPVTVPSSPNGVSIHNFFGLGIDAGSGGFNSAGIVINGLFSVPE